MVIESMEICKLFSLVPITVKGGFEFLSPITISIIIFILVIFFLSDILEKIFKPKRDHNFRSLFFVLYKYNVRRFYPSQEETTHDTLYRGVESILRQGVSRPNIITLISIGRGASCTASSLAHSLSAVIMQLLNPFGPVSPSRYTVKGWEYTSADDYWEFNNKLIYLLSKFRVTVLVGFEELHPQVATILTSLANDSILNQPQAVVFVILNTGERFTFSNTTKTLQIGQTAIRECLGPFLENRELNDLVDALTWRCCLIQNEPSHRPSICHACNPPRRHSSSR